MKITSFGHSCFLVETGSSKIIFDPFIRNNPAAATFEFEKIQADYILVSHGHSDHTDDLLELAKQTGALIVAPYELVEWALKNGAPHGHGMNHGGQWNFDFGSVKMVSAVHSSRLPDGTFAGNPAGFVVRSKEGKNFYFAGDTALTYDMKLIGETEKIDFAFLPLGDNYTMGIDDAVLASGFIQCKKIIGMHYDTFETIRINQEGALQKFSAAGIELILMKSGKSIVL